MLQVIPGKEAFIALSEIAQAHPDPRSRAWFQHLAKSRSKLTPTAMPGRRLRFGTFTASWSGRRGIIASYSILR